MKPPHDDKKPVRSKASSRAHDYTPVYGGIEKRRMSPEAFEKFKREASLTAEPLNPPDETVPPVAMPDLSPPADETPTPLVEEPVPPTEPTLEPDTPVPVEAEVEVSAEAEPLEDLPPAVPDPVVADEDPPPPHVTEELERASFEELIVAADALAEKEIVPLPAEPEPVVVTPPEEMTLEAFRLMVNLPSNQKLFGAFVRERLTVMQKDAAEVLGYPGRGGFNNNLNGQAPWRADRLERVLAFIGTDVTHAWLALKDRFTDS